MIFGIFRDTDGNLFKQYNKFRNKMSNIKYNIKLMNGIIQYFTQQFRYATLRLARLLISIYTFGYVKQVYKL